MKAERAYPRFTITAKGTRWVEGGHPWIYAQEIVSAPEGVENGALVDAVSEKGKYLGSGFFSRESKIRIRLLSRNANDRFDADFWRRRIRYAWDYRKTVMGADVSCCRVIFGEADGFPGLTVDRFENLLVTQTLSVGMERIKEGEVNAYAPRPLTRKERAEKNRVQARRAWRLFTADVMKLFRKKPKSQTPEEFVRSGEMAKYKICCIRDALDASIGYISKDRDKETLVMPASIRDNICLSAADMLSAYGVIPTSGEKELARVQAENLRIKCSSVNQEVRELSGGNKQKVSFAKWIGNKSKILVLDSPTRGVDVGVKTTMYQLLYDLKKQGYAIVIISEELSELIGMSDRIEIMKDGRIAKEFVRSESLRDTDIINYMI